MRLFSRMPSSCLTLYKKPWNIEQPCVLKFLVNDTANFPKVAQALANPLFFNVRFVEINQEELTVRLNLAELADILFKKLPKLAGICLIANSLGSDQAIESIGQISQVVKSHSAHLDVVVSLSRAESILENAQIRVASFENLVRLIDFIQASDLVSSSRLRYTVTKENIYALHDWLELAIEKEIYINYNFEKIYQQFCLYGDSHLEFEEKYHLSIFLENLIWFYEKSNLQKFFYRSVVRQLMYSKSHSTAQGWQPSKIMLSAGGELQYCIAESSTPGSVTTQDPQYLYKSNKGFLTGILRSRHNFYLHDYSGFPPAQGLLKAYARDMLKNLELPITSLKTLKALKPLKLFKQRLAFHRQMNKACVNQAALLSPQPAFSFPQATVGKRKVLICGWYGTETLGDKAILGGVIHSIRASLGDFELHLVSLDEVYVSQMTVLQMVELQGCTLHPVADATNLASSMDLVVFGGGPLMAINSLAEMVMIFQKAVEARVPTLIAGCGVGPLGAPYYNEAIRSLLLHASYRIYRDPRSMQLAKSLGIDTTHDKVAEDPAFTWLETCLSVSNPSVAPQVPSRICPKLLLGLRDWPYFQYAPELSPLKAEQLKQRFEKEVIAALELLLDRYPGLKVIPFPMCTNHIGGDDRWFYRNLFRGCHNLQEALDLTFLGAELSPIDAVNIFKSASVAMTMRFHSLVFALATGIPTVAVDYTAGRGKVNSLAEKYHVPQMGIDTITREFIFSSVSTLLDTPHSRSTFTWQRDILMFKHLVGSFITSLG